VTNSFRTTNTEKQSSDDCFYNDCPICEAFNVFQFDEQPMSTKNTSHTYYITPINNKRWQQQSWY